MKIYCFILSLLYVLNYAQTESESSSNDSGDVRVKSVSLDDTASCDFTIKLEKLENGNNLLQQSMENLSQQIEKILTKLSNIDMQCSNKMDASNEDNENLTGSSQTSVRSCTDYGATDCADDKCLIQIDLYGSEPFEIACNNSVDGGGWIVIQRRIDGSVNFYRGWSKYKTGFGNTDGEFFIGLDKLHALTTSLEPVELLIQLQDFANVTKYAKYDDFQVASETENYKLIKLGAYSGNAGDSFSYHLGLNFTTKDRDNDGDLEMNCAITCTGGWWYNHCYQCNLNGKYYQSPNASLNGIIWGEFYDAKYTTLKFVQMLIRPRKL